MELIPWNDSLSLHIEAIDVQHKKWVAMLNSLHEAMGMGKGQEVLKKLMKEVVDYTLVHFANEEKYMKDLGYPEFAGHKAVHDKMTLKVQDIKSRFESGQIMISMELMTVLKDWLTNHILNNDKKYAPFFQQKGVR